MNKLRREGVVLDVISYSAMINACPRRGDDQPLGINRHTRTEAIDRRIAGRWRQHLLGRRVGGGRRCRVEAGAASGAVERECGGRAAFGE